jgi:hypothetical protein
MGGTPSIPPPPPPPELVIPPLPAIEMPTIEFPAPYDPEAAAAKARRAEEIKQLREIERRRKGYGSTLITGGRGLEDEPPVKRPKLGGM